jgi:hypothetical protein
LGEMRHICTHLQTHPEALIERAITLRIHKNEEKNKNERSSTSRVSFLVFLHARARTRNEARARAKKGARSILVFPKVASSKFKFRGRPRRRREIRMAREAVMRRVAKVKSLFAFFFSSRVRSRKRDALTRRGGTKFSPPICHSECPFNYLLLLLLFALLTFLWRRD